VVAALNAPTVHGRRDLHSRTTRDDRLALHKVWSSRRRAEIAVLPEDDEEREGGER